MLREDQTQHKILLAKTRVWDCLLVRLTYRVYAKRGCWR
jgi:hypothetical protein